MIPTTATSNPSGAWLAAAEGLFRLKQKVLVMNADRLKAGLLLLGLLVFLSGCAPALDVDPCRTAEPYGFLGGLWHGIIAPLAFIISLLDAEVAMYAVNNNGGWYDFGFVLGSGILFGGGSRAVKNKS
jgi:hypothetical protein